MATKTFFGQPIGGSVTSSASYNPNLGSNYEGLLSSNPYVGVTRQQKWWEPFASWLGITTPTEKWQQEMQLQANEYNASIAQQAYAEQYNSPVEQAARERAAGINPDLAGGIASGEAQTPGQDPSIPNFDYTNGPDMFRYIGEGLMNCITSGLALADSFSSTLTKLNEASLSGLKKSMDANSMFDNYFRSILPESPGDFIQTSDGSSFFIPSNAPDPKDMVHRMPWKEIFFTRGEFSLNFLPKKYRKKAMQRLAAFIESAPASEAAWSSWSKTANARSSYNANEDNIFAASSGVLSDVSTELQHLRKEIIDLSIKSQKSDLQTNLKENESRSAYLGEYDSKQEAASHNAKNRLDLANNDMLGAMRESLDKIVSKLEKRGSEPGWQGTLAQCVLVMVSLLQLKFSSSSSPLISTTRKEFNTNYNGSYTRVNGATGEIY